MVPSHAGTFHTTNNVTECFFPLRLSHQVAEPVFLNQIDVFDHSGPFATQIKPLKRPNASKDEQTERNTRILCYRSNLKNAWYSFVGMPIQSIQPVWLGTPDGKI